MKITGARRQYGDGIALLWRDGDGPRRGVLFALRGCANRICPCRDVQMQGWRVDDTLLEASATDGSLKARFANGVTPALESVMRLSIDVDTGVIKPMGEVPDDELAWVQSAVDGAMLDALSERFLAAKKWRTNPEQWRETDWSWWKPGGLVPWQHAVFEGREDRYVLDGTTYLADDYYCVTPGCQCGEVKVSFHRVAGSEVEPSLGDVSVTLPGCDHPAFESAPEDRALVQELWRRFTARHEVRRLFSARTKTMQSVGVELFKRRAPSAPHVAPPSVGRNDPCPCGSGKKYKKCCADKRPN